MDDPVRDIVAQMLPKGKDFDWRSLGEIGADFDGDLVILNYTQACQFQAPSEWNRYEKVCRGLILNWKTGEIVARPFPKFFNYSGEYVSIKEVTEKIDGSLGILYRSNGIYNVSTRGRFHSPQAEWATEFFLNYDFDDIDNNHTYLFEIIYPQDKKVVDYQGQEALYLLGVTHRLTGYDYDFEFVQKIAKKHGFPTPKTYDFTDVKDIVELAKKIDHNQEGWVIRNYHGTRYKIKGDAYFEMARLLSQISFRHTVEAIEQGTYDDLVERIPDEFLGQVRQWKREIEDECAKITGQVFSDISSLVGGPLKSVSRKEFALSVMKEHRDRAPLYFAALDGHDIRSLILKRFIDNNRAAW